MLAIHCKRTENVELKNPILSYVREMYSDREADDAMDDLAAIQGLRNEIVIAQTGTQGALKDSLTKWVWQDMAGHNTAKQAACKYHTNETMHPFG